MKVVVLMSTWQGERFIEEQLLSILGQLPPDGRVIVRDDGSTDGVVQRIRDIGDSRVSVTCGENLGFARSFFSLLAAAPLDADVFMLSDQDDVWLPGKIARAVDGLARLNGRPGLYFSRLQLVDEELRPMGLSSCWPRQPSFRNALVENIAIGNTCAMNRAGLLLARETGDLRLVHFHDWWLYLVISALGEVVADPEPTILYRQHSTNAVGAGQGWRRYLQGLRLARKQHWIRAMFGQIENFRRLHAARLSPEDQNLLERYFNPQRPVSLARLLLLPVRLRQKLSDEVLLRLLILSFLGSGRRLLPYAAPARNNRPET
jgi:glycosyltransferase involved in cell wall biosynthesis